MMSGKPARHVVPTRADLADAAFILVLSAAALAAMRSTYPDRAFLWVGTSGLVLGLVVAHLANALRQPVIVMAAATVLTFFLFSGVLLDREQALGGVLPTVGVLRDLALATVHSWKDLLTTPAPVDNGSLLVIPYTLGLLCGAAGLTLARRVTAAAAPISVPAAALGATILFGTDQPAARLLDGVGFALGALYWAALRRHRQRPAGRAGSRRAVRLATGVAVLAAAAGAGSLLGPWLPGASGHRVVLRDYVTPPFDLRDYPSPLVGFRKYTKDANQLWDQKLFTVSGLPDGATVRIATLDDYDGSVWGATNGVPGDGFQRVGSHITSPHGTAPQTTLRITIAAAYASASDVNAWLPGAGSVAGIEFSGRRQTTLADSLRYNVGTSTGIVAARLQAGDGYTVRTVIDPVTIPQDAQPFGPPNLSDTGAALVSSHTAEWTKGATGVAARVRAAAAFLHDNGAYSDGGPGERQYLPGHSVGRLSSFLNSPHPVGDDEQYAAAFALIANSLGMPTRVVLGAVPGAGGVVRGRDIHAWVEIHLADGTWAPIPTSEFMPDTSKKPDRQPPQQVDNANSAVVPPPNTIHPPSTLADAEQPASNRENPPPPSGLWRELIGILATIAAWGGPPVLTVSLVFGSIITLKARRRRRRRTRGLGANRYAGAWQELVDHARDFGAVVPVGQTRLKDAELLGTDWVCELACQADATVYGPEDPTDSDAAAYWRRIDEAREALSRAAWPWRRLLAVVNPRSLLVSRLATGMKGPNT